MDFTIPLREREARLAEALQAKLQLRNISLYRCEAAGAGPPLGTVEPVRLAAELESELEHTDSSGVDYAVTLRVACAQPLTFHIQVTFLACYRFAAPTSKGVSKGELEAFRKSHAVLAVWPYMREFVQTIAARMGFPTETLPLLRLVLHGAANKPA
jgi:preprotein translocase subunit SecB